MLLSTEGSLSLAKFSSNASKSPPAATTESIVFLVQGVYIALDNFNTGRVIEYNRMANSSCVFLRCASIPVATWSHHLLQAKEIGVRLTANSSRLDSLGKPHIFDILVKGQLTRRTDRDRSCILYKLTWFSLTFGSSPDFLSCETSHHLNCVSRLQRPAAIRALRSHVDGLQLS